MNASAYVMDTDQFGQNHIKFKGIEKLRLFKGSIQISCHKGSTSAERFLMEQPEGFTEALQNYSIPSGIIVDLHADAELLQLAIPVPATEIQEPVVTVTRNLSEELHNMLEEGLIVVRSINVILEIAHKQKITEVEQFFERNTRATLQGIKGCGAGTIQSLEELAERHNLVLRES